VVEYLSFPQGEEVYDLYVNQLMVEREKRWDLHKIQTLFSIDAVETIMSMPLFQTVREDKLIWDGNKEGKYSDREGYRMLMNDK
jgi:hypothetical protein